MIKLTTDNSDYTDNNIELFAKLNAAVGTGVTLVIKMVATDGAADTQFDSGNTSSIAVDIKDTPKMVTNIFAITPNTNEGLTTSPTHASVGNEGNANGTTT